MLGTKIKFCLGASNLSRIRAKRLKTGNVGMRSSTGCLLSIDGRADLAHCGLGAVSTNTSSAPISDPIQ